MYTRVYTSICAVPAKRKDTRVRESLCAVEELECDSRRIERGLEEVRASRALGAVTLSSLG